jgi:hypothetical protein
VSQPVCELPELYIVRRARAKDKPGDVVDSDGVTVSKKCVSISVTSCTVLTNEAASWPATVLLLLPLLGPGS